MQEKIIFKRIDYWFPIIFALIEGIALLIIAFLTVDNTIDTTLIKNFFGGFIDGVVGLFFVFVIINFILKKKKILLNNKRLIKIDYLYASIYCGVFLAFLFLIESALSSLKKINIIFGNSFVALIIISLTVPILIFIYNRVKILKRVSFITDKRYYIEKAGIAGIFIFGALYEMIFLPISAYLSKKAFLYAIIGDKFGFALIGLITGFISAFITVIIYNNTKKPKILLEVVD